MAINNIKNANIKATQGINPNLHKTLTSIKQEEKQSSSIFIQEELARLTGENANSDTIQSIVNQANNKEDLNELLGLYLSASGKAADAKYTDKTGKEQTVSINDLTTDELKAVASGSSNPLASRNQESKLDKVNDIKTHQFGSVTSSQHGVKIINDTDNSEEFISTMKEISSEGPEITDEMREKAKAEASKPTAMESSEISESNGYQCIAEAQNEDKAIQKDIYDIKRETMELKRFCDNKKSKNQILHNTNERLNNKNNTKKSGSTGNFLTATSKTATNNLKNKNAQQKNITNNTGKEKTKFLGITTSKTASSNSNVTNPISNLKSNVTVKASASVNNSAVTQQINNNIEKTNTATNTLKENEVTLQDTASKATQARNFAQISESYKENSIKAAATANNNKTIAADNSQANIKASAEAASNATEAQHNANNSEVEMNSLTNAAETSLDSSKALKTQSTNQLAASKTITKNATTELANVSVSNVLAEASLECATNSVNATKDDFDYANDTENKADNYYNAAIACDGSIVASPLSAIFFYQADRLYDKSDDIKNVANKKLAKAKSEQAAAQAKINDIQEQKEQAQKDIQSGKALEKLSNGSLEKSKEEKENSLQNKIQASVKGGEKVSYENMANNSNNLSKMYDGNAKLQAAISELNSAFVSRETTNSNKYATKAASQNSTADNLEATVNTYTSKQNEMVNSINESIDNNNENISKLNNSDKKHEEQNVEKFEKQQGAQETDRLSSNNIDKMNDTSSIKVSAKFGSLTSGIGALDIINHEKVQKPKLVFGAQQNENQDDNNQEKNNIQDNNDENVKNVNNSNAEEQNNPQQNNNEFNNLKADNTQVEVVDVKKVPQI